MHSLIEHIHQLIDDPNEVLTQWAVAYAGWIYGILFLIIFCETGLVVAPFLPGDSLLLAAGIVAAKPGGLELWVLLIILPIAAVLGDNLNYFIGRAVGPRVFRKEGSRWFSTKTLVRTQAFYDKHGPKTVVLARFVPLVRTFAPFVAGVGRMYYPRFMVFGVIGAFLWVLVCCGAGALLDGDWIKKKDNFKLVILAITCISLLPPIIGWLNRVLKEKKAGHSGANAEDA